MSICCCICRASIRRSSGRNIFEERITLSSELLISDVLLQCLEGLNYKFRKTRSNIEVCRKCCERLLKYFNATQLCKQIRIEILKLLNKNENASRDSIIYVAQTNKYSDLDASIDELHAEDAAEATELEEVVSDIETIETKVEVEEDLNTLPADSVAQEEFLIITDAEAAAATEDEKNVVDSYELQEDCTNVEDACDGTEIVEFDDDNYILDDIDTEEDERIYFTPKTKTKGRTKGKKAISLDKYTLQCTQCDESFTSRTKYQSHVNKKHFAGYVCEECGKTLHSYSGFMTHRQNHNPEQLECHICGSKHRNKINLKHHMAWHSGEQPYQCEICSKRFVHRIGLFKHKQIHDETTRRIECEICGFKFRSKGHLRRHMITHTKVKAFSCPICSKCFSQSYNMNAHIREHQNPGSTRKQRLKCKKCTRTFTNTQNYQEHCKLISCESVTK